MLELLAHLAGIPHPEGLDQLVLQMLTTRPRFLRRRLTIHQGR